MEALSLSSREPSTESEGFSGSEFSDELDHVPLARRRRILFGIQQRLDLADCSRSGNPSMFGVKQDEHERCKDILSLTPACSSRGVGTSEAAQNCNNEDPAELFTRVPSSEVAGQSALGDCLQNGNSSHDVGPSGLSLSDGSQHIECNESDGKYPLLGNHDTGVCISSHRLMHFEASSEVKAECSDNLLHSEEGVLLGLFSSGDTKTKIKDECCDYVSDDHLDHVVLKERQRMLLSGKLMRSTKPFLEGGFEGFPGGHSQPALKENETNGYAIHNSAAAKGDNNVWSPPTNFRIKDEPLYNNEVDEDEVDNMTLGDRMKLQRSQDESELRMLNEFSKNSFPIETKCSPIMSEPGKAYSFSKLRKRKKTATDSVETALEEDAPGLLQVLIDKGILVDEIKLYGEPEKDEPIDETSIEDSFTDLESVMSKIFAQSQSLLKLAPIRCAKGTRASYCLACLISLVEQTRYLRFRKWPAEWGWCRDLQSFIFVFERHNRIVLERPEYGFATYFFELEDSLPIDWQIKRLVTAMKFTNCSRISLIENRAFSVGEDMTEGEAKVLIAYGWVPNTGLATMLKYRDRVVHDRKNETDASEWRSKIGKLLMDGYNGGTVVSMSSPEKLMEFQDSQNAQIKVEIYDT